MEVHRVFLRRGSITIEEKDDIHIDSLQQPSGVTRLFGIPSVSE